MFTFQAIQILIFLIPGFISSRVIDALIVRKPEHKELESVIEALIFSMLIYTLASFVGLKSPVALDTTMTTVIYPEPWSFVWLIAISMMLPVLFAGFINNDLHMRLVRWFRVTKKTSRLSVWNDAFYDKKARVIIDFVDQTRLFGWVEHFSDYPDNPFLYVTHPQWVNGDEFEKIEGVEGLLITPEQKIVYVEFLKDDTPTETSLTLKRSKENGKTGKS